MKQEPISVLLNPVAGRGRAAKRAADIVEILQSGGISSKLIQSTAVGDLEHLAFDISKSSGDRIIVAGGDGSVHEVVNGILKAGGNAGLGIIPIGTGNDFAKASHTPLDWRKATTALAARLFRGEPVRKIDAGRMNDRFFANGVGIGFDAKINRIAKKYQWPIGDIVYLFAVLEGLWDGVITPNVEMTYDSVRFDGPVTLANISNGPWVGGMFHIAPMANNSDGRMELLVVKPVTRRRIVTLLPKLMDGEHMQETEIVHRPVTALRIKAEIPIPSHLDGEVQPLQTDFELTVLPEALDLL